MPADTVKEAELLTLRKNLIREEVGELFEAIDEGKHTHILKELVDIVVVCVGMADTYGWDFDEAFKQVHVSNMSKLDNNGQPIYRKDGKVLKSDNYVPPDLSDLV
jgi:NTP pyrophosphatase (non-canonical NTP hydrolase)